MSVRIAVLASGRGTNLQALIDHFRGGGRRVGTVAVAVSDNPEAGALQRAAQAGIPTRVIPVSGRSMGEVAAETLEVLRGAAVHLVALAGYLRLVPAEVVAAYRGRIVNVHPALLPGFGGKGMYGCRVHEAVLAAGARVSGATVHIVDEEYDRGSIVAQWPVPVWPDDTPESLAARVLTVEHEIYPAAVEALARAVAEGRAVEPFRAPGVAFTTTGADAAKVRRQIRAALQLP
ncbi:MAG: phosphoribosylglycinamide formyltransferase [Gemmatimonadetes bacterium]|nr:phosphoribosylglycinamide formyltransferase [Gemmatimonadota bacterium]